MCRAYYSRFADQSQRKFDSGRYCKERTSFSYVSCVRIMLVIHFAALLLGALVTLVQYTTLTLTRSSERMSELYNRVCPLFWTALIEVRKLLVAMMCLLTLNWKASLVIKLSAVNLFIQFYITSASKVFLYPLPCSTHVIISSWPFAFCLRFSCYAFVIVFALGNSSVAALRHRYFH